MKDLFFAPAQMGIFSLFFLVFSPFAFPPPPPLWPQWSPLFNPPRGRFIQLSTRSFYSTAPSSRSWSQPDRTPPWTSPKRALSSRVGVDLGDSICPAHPLRNRRCCWVQRMTVAGKRRGRGLGSGATEWERERERR